MLKRYLREIGYDGPVEKTFSYTKLTEHSGCNVRNQIKDIIHHTLRPLVNDEAEDVWIDIIKNDEYTCLTNER